MKMENDPQGNSPADNGRGDHAKLPDEFQRAVERAAKAKESGRDQEALSEMLKAFSWAAEEAEKNPTPDLLLLEKAHQRECAGDWAGAEKARREVLRFMEEQEHNLGMIAKAHRDLSRFFQLRGSLEDAWEAATAATAAARRFELEIFLAMMLENEARCALLRGEPDRGLQAVEEALGIIESTRMTQHFRARLWVARARCLAAKHNWTETETALSRARELMGEDEFGSCCPGPVSTEAAWWEVQAVVCGGRGNMAGSVEAWREAVARRRQVHAFAHLKGPYTLALLADALDGVAQALTDQGGVDEAAHCREEAAQIRRAVEGGCAPTESPEDLR